MTYNFLNSPVLDGKELFGDDYKGGDKIVYIIEAPDVFEESSELYDIEITNKWMYVGMGNVKRPHNHFKSSWHNLNLHVSIESYTKADKKVNLRIIADKLSNDEAKELEGKLQIVYTYTYVDPANNVMPLLNGRVERKNAKIDDRKINVLE